MWHCEVRFVLIMVFTLTGGLSTVMAKEKSILVTQQMRQNAVANANRFEWAQQQRDRAVVRAQRWLERSDEELWEFVPSPDTPRSSRVNRTGRNTSPYRCGHICGRSYSK